MHSRIVLPPDTPRDAAVVFWVDQSASGEIKSVKLVSSTGFKPYEVAIEKAIYRSSPLPPAPSPDVFRAQLELRFRP